MAASDFLTVPAAGASLAKKPVTIAGTLGDVSRNVLGWVDAGNTWHDANETDGFPFKVVGSVAVTGAFYQATQPVSGTFWQATQPVSGPLTDAQLRASTVPISGSISTLNGLTDAQLRASALNVNIVSGGGGGGGGGAVTQSGAWTVGISPAQTIGVTGTFFPATQPVSGTFFQATQPVSLASQPLPTGASTEATLAAIKTGVDLLHSDNAAGGSLPAGTNLLGSMGTKQLNATGAALAPKFAFADLTATGDVVAAVAGKQIKVLSYAVICGSVAASVRFQSGGTSSISPVMSFGPAGGIAERDEFGLFQTLAGEKLTALMSGTGPLAVRVTYVEY